MQVLALEKNRGYLIVGIGAIVALFAFAFLPHIAISDISANQTTNYNVSSISQFQISVWVEGLMAATAITIVALIAFKPNPFSFLKSTSLPSVQIQYANYFLIGTGILGIMTQLIITFSLSSQLQQIFALVNSSIAASPGATVSFASGSWLYLLGMLAVIGGGFLASRTMQKNVYQPSLSGQYTPPVAQQPWMVNPYEVQSPQQQWNTGQSVPTAYQQGNTGPHMPPTQMVQPNTGQPLPPTQQQAWNTGQPLPPTQQQQWNTGQSAPQGPPQPWFPGQQPPPRSPYQ